MRGKRAGAESADADADSAHAGRGQAWQQLQQQRLPLQLQLEDSDQTVSDSAAPPAVPAVAGARPLRRSWQQQAAAAATAESILRRPFQAPRVIRPGLVSGTAASDRPRTVSDKLSDKLSDRRKRRSEQPVGAPATRGQRLAAAAAGGSDNLFTRAARGSSVARGSRGHTSGSAPVRRALAFGTTTKAPGQAAKPFSGHQHVEAAIEDSGESGESSLPRQREQQPEACLRSTREPSSVDDDLAADVAADDVAADMVEVTTALQRYPSSSAARPGVAVSSSATQRHIDHIPVRQLSDQSDGSVTESGSGSQSTSPSLHIALSPERDDVGDAGREKPALEQSMGLALELSSSGASPGVPLQGGSPAVAHLSRSCSGGGNHTLASAQADAAATAAVAAVDAGTGAADCVVSN